MFIFHKLEMIYICVPKTGSTSFIRAMIKHDYIFASPTEKPNHFVKHSYAKDVRRWIKQATWDKYHKIGFIRHPYDWVRSLYNLPGPILGEENAKAFPQYVKDLKLTMFDWFTDDDGNMLIDEVLRLEDIKDIYLRYNVKGKHLNSSRQRSGTMLTDGLKKIIRDKFKREMTYYERV